LCCRKTTVSLGFLFLVAVFAGGFGKHLPTGFLPEEDQGYFYVNVQLPLAASMERQVFVNVDRDKVLKQGVPLDQVYQTLQAFMGGVFINFFNRFGRE